CSACVKAINRGEGNHFQSFNLLLSLYCVSTAAACIFKSPNSSSPVQSLNFYFITDANDKDE
ncbi:hypothetical protein A2U01_0034970, partial [Trifolium medium]|nr:hypothetical protein [Trifolium medium]